MHIYFYKIKYLSVDGQAYIPSQLAPGIYFNRKANYQSVLTKAPVTHHNNSLD